MTSGYWPCPPIWLSANIRRRSLRTFYPRRYFLPVRSRVLSTRLPKTAPKGLLKLDAKDPELRIRPIPVGCDAIEDQPEISLLARFHRRGRKRLGVDIRSEER